MKPVYLHLTILSCIWGLFPLAGENCNVSLGPQLVHVKRTKDGGTTQRGNLIGGYFTFNRIKRCRLYCGAELSYAKGNLKGSIDKETHLHSKFTDVWIEGRLGYTFQQKEGKRFSFTPFLGAGYACEKNNFNRSSPLRIHFKTHYYYYSAGFLTSIRLSKKIDIGILFRARIPYNPKCKVSHDPENESLSQKVSERVQYRMELPLTYRFDCYEKLEITANPFYEYRPYGGHVNFPFDFFKTTLNFWGASLNVVYQF